MTVARALVDCGIRATPIESAIQTATLNRASEHLANGLLELPQQKTPRRGGGALLGLLQGGERPYREIVPISPRQNPPFRRVFLSLSIRSCSLTRPN
jgi:hypothetical protein